MQNLWNRFLSPLKLIPINTNSVLYQIKNLLCVIKCKAQTEHKVCQLCTPFLQSCFKFSLKISIQPPPGVSGPHPINSAANWTHYPNLSQVSQDFPSYCFSAAREIPSIKSTCFSFISHGYLSPNITAEIPPNFKPLPLPEARLPLVSAEAKSCRLASLSITLCSSTSTPVSLHRNVRAEHSPLMAKPMAFSTACRVADVMLCSLPVPEHCVSSYPNPLNFMPVISPHRQMA